MKKREFSALCIKHDKKTVLDREITYKLFLVRKSGDLYYTIRVSDGDECEKSGFGSVRSRAVDIYQKIVRNEVTPCTLRDIAEDFAKER